MRISIEPDPEGRIINTVIKIELLKVHLWPQDHKVDPINPAGGNPTGNQRLHRFLLHLQRSQPYHKLPLLLNRLPEYDNRGDHQALRPDYHLRTYESRGKQANSHQLLQDNCGQPPIPE